MNLSAYLAGVGVLGPGLKDWPETASILSGVCRYMPAATVLPHPTILASAERRRSGRVVKLALAVAMEATNQARAERSELASVFSSSGGDGQNCHEICEALAQPAREISPTRFSNSVHNAAAGYWSIATGATAESNVLCAFDASFAAGLLEAITQVAVDRQPVMLVAYDTEYPEPLRAERPIPDAFGAALVLTPERQSASLARLNVSIEQRAYDTMADRELEALRSTVPAARCLTLLRAWALRETAVINLEYLGESCLVVQTEPCV
jgi:hypothetical protein